jgi:LmbE family N-acetylglucosaminyl deacetylase/ElaB/YqjD/DUF883 family membrane-anchored ribosome-binding protein
MKHLVVVLVIIGLWAQSATHLVDAAREERLPDEMERVTQRVHEARRRLEEAEQVLEKEGHHEHEKQPGFLERVKETLHMGKPEPREKEYVGRDYEREYPTETARRKLEEGKEYVKRQFEPEKPGILDSIKETLHLKPTTPSPTEYVKAKGQEWFGTPSSKEESYLGIPYSVWDRIPRRANEAKEDYIDRVKNYFSWLSRKAGETEQEYSDRLRQGYEELKHRASETVEQTKHKAQEAGETIKGRMAETGEAIKHKAQEAGETIKHKAQEAGETIKGRVAETGEAIKHKAQEAGETVRSKIGGVFEGLKHGAEELKHRAEESVRTVEHKAEDVGYGIKSKFQDLGEGIKEKVYPTKEREGPPFWREQERERVIKEYVAVPPTTHWYTPIWDLTKAALLLVPASLAAVISLFGVWELYAKSKQFRTLYPPGYHSTFATWERSGPSVSGKAEKVAEPSRREPALRVARAAFILAHADDETMFFAPTITDIKKMGHEVFMQVMTAGSLKADPRSNMRKQELLKAAHIFGVHTENIEVVDDPRLVERGNWLENREILNTHVRDFIQRNAITHIYTFDRFGVTGYLNHNAVHHAVRDYVNAHPDVRAYELQTVWKPRQWMGFLDVLWTLCDTVKSRRGHLPADFLYLHMNPMPIEMYYAVDKVHWVRLVLARLLRVLLNRYAFINSWRQIPNVAPIKP